MDDGGIDMLSLLLQGGRTSLLVGFAAALVSMIVGGGIGILAGYFGGWLDRILIVVCDAIYAFPTLLLAIVVGSYLTMLRWPSRSMASKYSYAPFSMSSVSFSTK